MKFKNHHIDLNNTRNLLKKLTPLAEDIRDGWGIRLEINLCNCSFVHSESLVMLAAFYNYAKNKTEITAAADPTCDCRQHSYAERIDFFKLMDIDFGQPQPRKNPNNNFLEITKLDKNNFGNKTEEMIKCIEKQFPTPQNATEEDQSLINLIYTALWELNTNIFDHSKSDTGYIYAQNYPNKNELKLCIVDTGIGIPESLKANAKYNELTHCQLLAKSVEKSVSSQSDKRGFGLYWVDEFTRANGGALDIVSGYSNYHRDGKNVSCNSQTEFWPGTCIIITFKTQNLTSYQGIVGNLTNFYQYKSSSPSLW